MTWFLLVLLAAGGAAWFASAQWAMTNAALDSFLDLLFLNAGWANIGDATGLRGSSSAGSFWISLHTADPGVSGSQNTSEVAYTGYTRVSVARSGSGWTRTGQSLSPTSQINFPACTAGSATATFAGIGTDSSGAGHLVASGAITPNIAISNGIIPELTTASAFTVV